METIMFIIAYLIVCNFLILRKICMGWKKYVIIYYIYLIFDIFEGIVGDS